MRTPIPQTSCSSSPFVLVLETTRHSRLALVLLTLFNVAGNASAIGQARFVETAPSPGSFAIVQGEAAANLYVDVGDHAGVVRVASDLRQDVNRVTGVSPGITHDADHPGTNAILIGTIGRSALIDQLIREQKLEASDIAGQWESYVVQVVPRPLPRVENALVIAGSDKRGTIYGVYDLSEQMGVSPWYWWADVPPKHHAALYVKAGRHREGPPAVKYRGIFINDEGPCLMSWARAKYGELNHGMYTNVFELILRLRGNYLWPAMWDNSFATDDPLNPKLANEYGVVMGTSHHEPMMRAWKEWSRAGNPPGSWDYSKNAEKLRAFWAEGLRRTKEDEKVITIGMRGDGDEPMSETESVALLERVVADQRQLIGEIINPDVEQVPQVWALYKEVQGYYERGMRVPDDVTLLWCDDNWGNIRRLPTALERTRSGGAGVYYHFDYVGGPRNYKWINTVPLPKIWEQMNLARRYGADRLWIVNVGDIKPMEFPIEFFLTFAWNPDAWPKDRVADFGRLWAEREFGPAHAADIADIMAKYTKYNGRRKPELLSPETFSLENYNEANRVRASWKAIAEKAERIYRQLPAESRGAFYELVLYPTKAGATVNELYIDVAKNRFYAAHGDGRANAFARRVRQLFQQDAELSDYYNHKLAGGKWNHMMDQTHIGYTDWQQPASNTMPAVLDVTNAVAAVDPLAQPHNANPPEIELPASWQGFVEADGYVSMEAEHFTGKQDTDVARWEVLPDHGRTLSAMTPFPVTARSVTPPQDSPCLQYRMWLSSTGTVEVTLLLSPCLNFQPDRGVRIAVSFDDDAPQILMVVPKGYTAGDGNRDWEEAVEDSIRRVQSKHTIATSGSHTLKVWMVDPAVVLQKIVVDCDGVRPSYLGPPESHREGVAVSSADLAPPVKLTAEEDHQRMMDLLGITSIRRGRDGMNPQSPYYAHYDEARADPFPNLPDPLVLKNGQKVTTPEMWWQQRRPEIVEDFDREIYGRVPANTPKVNWEVAETTREPNGGVPVITKRLIGHVDNSGYPLIDVAIQMTLTTPARASGAVPVMLQFGWNFRGRFRSTSSGPDWKQQVLAKGWGYAVLIPTSVQADNGAGLTQGIIGLCNKGQPRQPDDWGALRAWAWGASRALDYFKTDPAVDAKRVGIEGHSRYGKAALVAMAYDPRFAITYVSSSGEGGAKLHRRDWGEIVENLAGSGEYHWMAGNFIKYAGPLNWDDLPVDSHELIALCAPRPVFISAGSTNGDAWVDAKGMCMAAVGAGPVYELLGKRDLGTTEFPPIGTTLIDGDIAFRQHRGGHTDAPNWPTFIQFAERYFDKPVQSSSASSANPARR